MPVGKPVVGLDADGDSEFLPIDLGTSTEDQDLTIEPENTDEDVTPEPQEDEALPIQASQGLTAADLKAILDERDELAEQRIERMTKRLQQSSRDSVRARVSKAFISQAQLLQGLKDEGILSEAQHKQKLNDLGLKVEQAVDEQMSQQAGEREPAGQKKQEKSSRQEEFNEVALKMFKSSNLTPDDPESKVMETIKLPSNYSDAVALYAKTLKIQEAKKLARVGGSRKAGTITGTGKGGVPTSIATLEAEMQRLMRQSGGDLAERQKRERRLDQLDEALAKLEKR